ncbi:MAG: hypothetical protein P8Y22_02825 [Sulfurimonas sp.]
MKLNKKYIFIIFVILLISNLVTFKLTYDFVDMKSFLLHTQLDAINLKAYDQNKTQFLDLAMNGGIDSILNDAGKIDNVEKYKSLCQVFDKELFEIVEKYHRINRERYGESHYPELQTNIAKGTAKMKKLCNVQK